MPAQFDDVRRSLGAVGAHIPSIAIGQASRGAVLRDAIGRLESAGYPAAWTNEGVGGMDVFVQAGLLLAASQTITVGTDIANIWGRAPQVAHAASAQLADAYPGRFVLGLGAGYPFQADQVGKVYKPLAAMREYLQAMSEPPPVDQPLDTPVARIVAANGPKMLQLAGEAADGALPGLVPPSYTAAARETLGPDRLLVVAVIAIFNPDRAAARAAARQVMSGALATPGSPFAANLIRLGFAEADIRSAADPILDQVIAHGNAADIAATANAHLNAGADHVVLQPAVGNFAHQLHQLEQIAPALTSLHPAQMNGASHR
jgi:probable F420-dependent oxidoreductase